MRNNKKLIFVVSFFIFSFLITSQLDGQKEEEVPKPVLSCPEISTLGKTIQVEGQNFAPHTTYMFKWGKGNTQFPCKEEMRTNEQGAFAGNIVLPAIVPAADWSWSTLLFAYDKTYMKSPIASKSMTIERTVLKAPDVSTLGKTIQVEGQNFAPHTTYMFKWGKGNTQFPCKEEMRTNEQGAFAGNIVLPAIVPAADWSWSTLLFAYDKTYMKSPIAGKSMTIERPILTCPELSKPGKTIQVKGENFAPKRTYVFKWGRGNKQWNCEGEVETDKEGNLDGEIVLPKIVLSYEPVKGSRSLFAYDKAGGYRKGSIVWCPLKIEVIPLDIEQTEIKNYLDPGESVEVGKYVYQPGVISNNKPWHYRPKFSDWTTVLTEPTIDCKGFTRMVSQSDLAAYGFPTYFLSFKGQDYIPVVIYDSNKKVVGHLIIDSSGNIVKDYDTIWAVFNTIMVLGGKDSKNQQRTSIDLLKEAVDFETLAAQRLKDAKEMEDFAMTYGIAERLATDMVAVYFSVATGDWVGAVLSAMNTPLMLLQMWAMSNENPKQENWVSVGVKAKSITDIVKEIGSDYKDLKIILGPTADMLMDIYTQTNHNFKNLIHGWKNFKLSNTAAAKAQAAQVAPGLIVSAMNALKRDTAIDAYKGSIQYAQCALAYKKMAQVLMNAADGINDRTELEDVAYLGLLGAYASEKDKVLTSFLVDTYDVYLKKDWRGWVYPFIQPGLNKIWNTASIDEVKEAGKKTIDRFSQNSEDMLSGFYFDLYLTCAETVRTIARIQAKDQE